MYSSDRIYNMCASAIFAAIIAVFSQISIPLAGGVPVTLQTFAVILAGVVLGAKWGAVSSLIYLFLGCIGIPVFAGFKGGVGALMGLTGGFAMSFPVLAFISGAAAEWAGVKTVRNADIKVRNSNLDETARLAFTILGAAAGAVVNYAFGCAWFAFIAGTGLMAAISACVLPFIINDVIKLVLACAIGVRLKRRLGMAGLKVSRIK